MVVAADLIARSLAAVAAAVVVVAVVVAAAAAAGGVLASPGVAGVQGGVGAGVVAAGSR